MPRYWNGIPHTEQITYANVHQAQQSTSSDTLEHSASQKHLDVYTQGTDQGSDEEENVCYQDNRLASENVTDLAPSRS